MSVLTPLARGLVYVAERPKVLARVVLADYVACSAAYALTEDHGPVEAAWWALVTASTVGYGDQYPETTPGRAVGAVLIASMFVLALISGAVLTAHLIPNPDRWSHEEQEEVKADIADARASMHRIEAMVSGLLQRERTQRERYR